MCLICYRVLITSAIHSQLFTVEAHTTNSGCVVCCREDGDQDGEGGELEGSNNSSDLLSHSSTGTGQLESPLPPQLSLDLDKQGKTSRYSLTSI